MCKRDEETVDYLMLHCPLGRELWGLVFKLFGVEWVMLVGKVVLGVIEAVIYREPFLTV